MKTCKYIENILIFSEDKISPCYSFCSEQAPFYAKHLVAGQENIEFEEKYNRIKSELNSSHMENYPCKNCTHLFETDESKPKYNLLIIKIWDNYILKYDILKIIKNLYEKDLIDKENLVVEFQCGDIRSSLIFVNLISYLKEQGIKKFNFLTNNLVYDSVVEQLLAMNKCEISVVFKYKKIEEKQKQHELVQVFKHYMEASIDKTAIKVFYTLIPNYNDTKSDLHQFIKLMYSAGINNLSLRLDYNEINKWINESVPLLNCPKHLDKFILYFFKLCKHYSFYSNMDYEEQNIVLRKIFKTNKILSLPYKIKHFFRRKNEV